MKKKRKNAGISMVGSRYKATKKKLSSPLHDVITDKNRRLRRIAVLATEIEEISGYSHAAIDEYVHDRARQITDLATE